MSWYSKHAPSIAILQYSHQKFIINGQRKMLKSTSASYTSDLVLTAGFVLGMYPSTSVDNNGNNINNNVSVFL